MKNKLAAEYYRDLGWQNFPFLEQQKMCFYEIYSNSKRRKTKTVVVSGGRVRHEARYSLFLLRLVFACACGVEIYETSLWDP